MIRLFSIILVSALVTRNLQAFEGGVHHYTVDLGLATVADLQVSILANDDIQSVDVVVESNGLGAWLSDFRSTVEVLRLADGKQILNGESTWGDTLSQVTVNWLPGIAAPTVDLYRSKPRQYEITPVDPTSIDGTVDPFRPVFEIGMSLDKSKQCKGEYRIYDGVRRYDLVITDAGIEDLIDLAFSGPAYRCNVAVKRIGGFSKKRNLFAFDESKITRVLYFGKIGKSWIPVRFEIDSPLGTAVARLKGRVHNKASE